MKDREMNRLVLRRSRAGQAIVELVVGLVAVIVLVAGIVQISTLGLMHSRVMTEARRLAGVQAMQDLPPFSGPDYIAARTVGRDLTTYSRDDDSTPAFVGNFQVGLLRYSDPNRVAQEVPDNEFTLMSQSQFPHLLFGLVEGRKSDSAELLPVMRNLVYRADRVEVEGRAWLTWTKGIY